jgi:site-specific DNA-methyltransferase (adenine-specific)
VSGPVAGPSASPAPPWDLRLGRWQDALADVEMVDAIVTDPPYSARTHAAQHSDHVAASAGFSDLEYSAWGGDDVRALVSSWAARVRGWWVVMSDHALQREWEEALEGAGLYVFAPIPQVTRNRSVRLAGDGPATWTCWITVARPRTRAMSSWGALPGAYVDDVGRRTARVVRGGKEPDTMRALIRDYTRPGDLVCDPCAGGATTLLAASMEGRRSIGAEMDPVTHAKALRRLQGGYTPDLFGAVAP